MFQTTKPNMAKQYMVVKLFNLICQTEINDIDNSI